MKFKKTYSRDNCFLIQEDWDKHYLTGFDGKKNPYSPAVINYINNGIVEIWENEKAVNWFIDSLFEKNKKDKSFFEKSIKRYNEILEELSFYWKKNFLDSISDLKKFLLLFSEGTRNFMIYYYTCFDKRNPQSLRNKALKIREADSYYDDSDRLTRDSINHIYPHISYDLALSIVSKELDNPPLISDLRKRNKNCVFSPNFHFEITQIKIFLKKHKNYQFVFDKIEDDLKMIKGSPAFKGVAKGKVTILKNKNKINEFEKGRILVSPMTTPIFLPAMKKASAIITDEGGVTCHAAVVSREFKKPCIVGTKIATRVLKDGDLVEVDANNGIIKILKRKK